MTTIYPSQSTPQFLKKYTRNVFNRVQHNAHVDGGHLNNDEAALALQVFLTAICLIENPTLLVIQSVLEKKIPVKIREGK